jgi:hypothetical protein
MEPIITTIRSIDRFFMLMDMLPPCAVMVPGRVRGLLCCHLHLLNATAESSEQAFVLVVRHVKVDVSDREFKPPSSLALLAIWLRKTGMPLISSPALQSPSPLRANTQNVSDITKAE